MTPAIPTDIAEPTIGHARQVIAQTASAWRIAPASARAVARRAPHGYVPARVMRRMRAVAPASGWPVLAHSW